MCELVKNFSEKCNFFESICFNFVIELNRC